MIRKLPRRTRSFGFALPVYLRRFHLAWDEDRIRSASLAGASELTSVGDIRNFRLNHVKKRYKNVITKSLFQSWKKEKTLRSILTSPKLNPQTNALNLTTLPFFSLLSFSRERVNANACACVRACVYWTCL